MALFGLSTLILARIHHLSPSSVPSLISSNRFKFSLTELSLRFEAIPFMRSSRIFGHFISNRNYLRAPYEPASAQCRLRKPSRVELS